MIYILVHTVQPYVVHFFVVWITVLLLVLWRVTRKTIMQACVKLPFGEKTRLGGVLCLCYFHNETRCVG